MADSPETPRPIPMTEEPSADQTASNDLDRVDVQGGLDESRAAILATASSRPFGPWASMALTILLLVLLVAIQEAVMLAVDAVRKGPAAHEGKPNPLSLDGFVISVATLVSSVVLVGVVALLAAARRYPLREYLALKLPTAKQTGLALCGLIVLMIASDSTSYLLGRPLVPEFMIDIYRTSPLSVLILAVVVAGVVSEEVMFRGFLYQGIASSRWGPSVAIFISSLFWALPHVQYDLYGVVTIALLGLYLGAVRFTTGSLLTTIMLHAFNNGVSLMETAYFAQRPI
jgi:membrane protease YdiL (CAAX protease family)